MRRKKLYFPVITILAVVLILFVLLGISTYRNLHRQRVRMEESLFRDGLIVLSYLEASFRSGWRGMMGRVENLQWLVSQVANLTDIHFIGLVDERGTILVHSDETKGDTRFPQMEKLERVIKKGGAERWSGKDGQFVVAKRFQPVRSPMMMGGMHGMHSMLPLKGGIVETILSGRTYAIVGLDTKTFDEARKSDIHHAMIMGLILFILGSASLYFIFLIQNYYIVNKTLDTMTTYTTNVVENMPDGLISIDANGDLVTVNNRAREIFNLRGVPDERGELKRKFLSVAIPLLDTLKDRKMVLEREIECLGRDNEPIPLAVSAAKLISEDGDEHGAVFILRDLREIKELQERVKRSERLASLGSLSAGVAHEIRNPLSSIKGFAQFFLKKTPPGSEDHKYSEVMIKEVERLNRVISNLLDFARPKDPVKEITAITDLINHNIELIKDDANSRKIEVMAEIEKGIPSLSLDKDQITQVLLNIELNALDAMQEGGTLSIRCFMDEVRKAIIVEIEDTGQGVPEEELPRIFDPFYTTKKKGTGLGLAIAHRVVENHNGTISVKSSMGEGTTFRIELPST